MYLHIAQKSTFQLFNKAVEPGKNLKLINVGPTFISESRVLSRGCQRCNFCTTESPQLFGFELATCRTCRLRSKTAILEVATSNLQK